MRIFPSCLSAFVTVLLFVSSASNAAAFDANGFIEAACVDKIQHATSACAANCLFNACIDSIMNGGPALDSWAVIRCELSCDPGTRKPNPFQDDARKE